MLMGYVRDNGVGLYADVWFNAHHLHDSNHHACNWRCKSKAGEITSSSSNPS